MADNNPRRPHPGQRYRHGWEPVTPQAAVEKNHGRKVKAGSAIARLLQEASASHKRMQQQDADRKAGKTPDMSVPKGAPTKSAAAKAGQPRGPESQKAEDALRAALGAKAAAPKPEKRAEAPAAKAPEEPAAKAKPAKAPKAAPVKADPTAKALDYAKKLPKKDDAKRDSPTMEALNAAQAAMGRGDRATAINALTKAMDTATPAEKKVISELRADLDAKAKARPAKGDVKGDVKETPKADAKKAPAHTSEPAYRGDHAGNPYANGSGAPAGVDRREGGKRVSNAEMEAAIEDVYQQLPNQAGWISMTSLREGLQKKGLTREQTDEVLKDMFLKRDDVNLAAASIHGQLRPQDHADAMKMGPEWQHQLKLTPRGGGRKGSESPAKPAPAKQEAPKPSPARSDTPAQSAPAQSAGKASSGTRSHDGAPVSGAKSSKPTVRNTWGAGASEVAYHPDGDLSNALKRMGDDRKLEIDGDSLENVVGRLVTDTYQGRRSSQEVLDEAKKIRDRLPNGSAARNAMDSAIRDMDAPNTPAPKVADNTPPALKQLVQDLHKVPEVRKDPGKDMDRLLNLINDWNAGKLPPMRLIQGLRTQVRNQRHESREGFTDINTAADKAIAALEGAARSGSLRPPGR